MNPRGVVARFGAGEARSVDDLWPDLLVHASDASGEERALRHVKDWVNSRAEAFHGRAPLAGSERRSPSGGWLGYWSSDERWEFVGIYQGLLEQQLKLHGYSPTAILEGWRERDWIDTEGDRYSKNVRFDGRTQRLIKIRRSALKANGASE